MIQLKENRGIPRSILLMMAIIAGLTVANCYYNQPLLELIRHDLGITEQSANLITVITQIGYALGLFFLIPLGDMFSRKKLILANMTIAAVMAIVMAVAQNVWMLWGASLLIGACSVIPQFFIPIAGQFSEPKSGYIGEWLGWREMFFIAAFVMIACMGVMLLMMPEMKRNYVGTYRGLMTTVAEIFILHPSIRIYSIRAAFGFGSMMAIWSCLAFHLAQPPFSAGSDMVGMLGLCGIMGAMAASGVGKLVPKFGIHKFSLLGAGMQIMAWGIALLFGDTYAGLIAAIILVDIGLQCQQLSNQSGCLQEIPQASNRANTIFMTTYFIGGSLGTFCAGYVWTRANWLGVCIVGITFAFISLVITLSNKK